MKKVTSVIIIFWFFIFMAFSSFASDNLLQNPSFEQESGAMPASWENSSWDVKPGVSEFNYEKGEAHSGDGFVTVTNNSENDARFTQNVSVKDNTTYRLSCWIKTENVGTVQNGKGANISVEGKVETSKDIKGTNGKWEYAEMYLRTGSGIDTIKVTVGIGGYGAINIGKASFDDVSAEEVGSVPAGAITAQLGDAGQNGTVASSSSAASPVGGPGKTLWYLILAAIVVAAGAAFYYFKYTRKDSSRQGDEERGVNTQLPEEELSTTDIGEDEKVDTEKSGIENTIDDISGSGTYDNEDLL